MAFHTNLSNSKGYGIQHALYFNGDETKYEIWEERMLGYMKVKNLKDIILNESVASVDRKEQCYAELIQFLDEKSLCLVMREAKNDGGHALKVLRQHYAGHSEPRIMSLYGQLSSLNMNSDESVTDYIIRAETIATSLKATGEIISDRLLNASVMKGLPTSYEPFTVNINASQKVVTFTEFKVQLRNFEENKKAHLAHRQQHSENVDGIMKMKHLSLQQQQNRNNNDHHHRFAYDDTPSRHYGPEYQQNIRPVGNSHNAKQNVGQYYSGKEETRPSFYNNNRPNNKYKSNQRDRNTSQKWCNLHNSSTHSNAECNNQQGRDSSYNGGGRRDVSNHINDFYEEPVKQNDCHDYTFYATDAPTARKETDTLLVDCGCTSHVSNDITKFISFDSSFNPSKHSIELADGKIAHNLAERRGTVKILIKNDENELCTVFLEKTLFIPAFPQEIFSVKAACNKQGKNVKGPKVLLDGEGGMLISKNGVGFPIHTKGNLYYLKTYDKIERYDKINRLGHTSKNDLLELADKVNVIKISPKTDEILCDSCIGKQFVTKCREADERFTTPLEFTIQAQDITNTNSKIYDDEIENQHIKEFPVEEIIKEIENDEELENNDGYQMYQQNQEISVDEQIEIPDNIDNDNIISNHKQYPARKQNFPKRYGDHVAPTIDIRCQVSN